MRVTLGLLCLLFIVACDTTGRTADLPPPSPPATANDAQNDQCKKPDAAPVSPAPVTPEPAKAAIVEVSPSEAWDRGLCQHRLPTTIVDAYLAGVFSNAATAVPETHVPDCKYAFAGSRLAGRMRDTLRIDGSLTIGQERLLRAVMLNPDALQEPDAQGLGLAQAIVAHNDIEMVNYLMQMNLWSTLSVPDQQKRWPLHFVRSREMLELLWNRHTLWQQDIRGEAPLNRMAARGDGEAVQFAVTSLCRDSAGYFPQRWAADVLELVTGNEINLADSAGRTPLMLAVSSGDIDSVNAFASCSSTVMNAMDRAKRTALHYAAARPNFTAGYAILVRGTHGLNTYIQVSHVEHVNVNAQDAAKDTPLHIAYRCGNIDAIKILKDFGADFSILNQNMLAASDPRSIAQGCPKNDAL